jgi:hypothetical protein
MTLREAASEMGLGADRAAARRLGYMIAGREAEIGKRIVIGGGRGRDRLVTIASLRQHFPELVDDRSVLAHMLADEVADIREDILLLKRRDNALAAAIRKLRSSQQ